MNISLPKLLTVDEFLAWGLTQPKEGGKCELLDGVVIMQQPQRWVHSQVKLEIALALREAISRAGVACFAAGEGPSIRVNEGKCFEPDALVAPLPLPDRDSLEVANAIVVVEVLSPSTARIDATVKLKAYFEVPSIQHYLIVDPDGRTITHHKRKSGLVLETRIVSEGEIMLEPPGISIDAGAIFGS